MQKIAKNSDIFPVFSQPGPLKKKKVFFFLVNIQHTPSIRSKFYSISINNHQDMTIYISFKKQFSLRNPFKHQKCPPTLIPWFHVKATNLARLSYLS